MCPGAEGSLTVQLLSEKILVGKTPNRQSKNHLPFRSVRSCSCRRYRWQHLPVPGEDCKHVNKWSAGVEVLSCEILQARCSASPSARLCKHQPTSWWWKAGIQQAARAGETVCNIGSELLKPWATILIKSLQRLPTGVKLEYDHTSSNRRIERPFNSRQH